MSDQATILRSDLIATFGEFGRALTVSRMGVNGDGVYDPSTGIVTPVSGAAPEIAYTGIGRVGTYADRLIDGTMITNKDRKVTFIPDDTSFVPEVNDRLTAGPDVYTVVSHKTYELGGMPIAYTLQVRR